jgi:hypothetical protein
MCNAGLVVLEARRFLRAVRGRRSQVAFSRRLGFRSNVCAKWESGSRMPTAATALRACSRAGIDVPAALHAFSADTAILLDPINDENVAAWLRAQLGDQPITRVAARARLSRFRISRFLNGQTRPRLPEFFILLHALTERLADFVALLVDVRQIPRLAAEHAKLAASRRAAFAHPWTSAVVALLDTDAFRKRGAVDAEVLAEALGTESSAAQQCLDVLTEAGVLRRRPGRYVLRAPLVTDTRIAPEQALALRRHWAAVSSERLASAGAVDWFGYSVFSVSRADYLKMRQLYADFYQSLRGLIADSQPSETVGLLTLHLVQWSMPEGK